MSRLRLCHKIWKSSHMQILLWPSLLTPGRYGWVSLYRRCLYCRDGEPGLTLWGSWHFLSSLRSGSPFHQREEDMEGHRFDIVAMNYFPYIEYSRDEDQLGTKVTLQDSLDTRMLTVIAEALNFT